MSVITIERKILAKNDEIARQNRDYLKSKNIFTLNLMSSPGAGKTSILEKTLEFAQDKINFAVIEGDVQTDNDAQRIAKYGIPVIQIVTNGGCHLEANLVKNALENLSLEGVQILFIENVGNLVCPTSYDLGEDLKIIISSTTEGDDKPQKYPSAFLVSNVCLINKIDLNQHLDFNLEKFKSNAKKINPKIIFFELSAKTGEGFDGWISWLKEKISQ